MNLESGYISASAFQTQRTGQFHLDRVQFLFPGKISSLLVSNNILIIALERDLEKGHRILRIDLSQAYSIDGNHLSSHHNNEFITYYLEIEILPKKSNDYIRKIFLDPLAHHLILTTNNGDNYYLNHTWKKPKSLSKLKVFIQVEDDV
jgi:hypothetical protein